MYIYILFHSFIYLVCFLGLHLQHMEVPRLGVESELQLPAYTTATGFELRLRPQPQLMATLDKNILRKLKEEFLLWLSRLRT